MHCFGVRLAMASEFTAPQSVQGDLPIALNYIHPDQPEEKEGEHHNQRVPLPRSELKKHRLETGAPKSGDGFDHQRFVLQVLPRPIARNANEILVAIFAESVVPGQ